MEKHTKLVVLVSILALSLVACQTSGLAVFTGALPEIRGSGTVVEEDRAVSDFDEVRLSGIGDVYIELGDTEALRVEAEDNLLEYLETEVHSGVLTIGTRERTNLAPTMPIRVYVTVVELDAIKLSGSGDIHAPDLETDNFDVLISGSGDVELGILTANSVRLRVNGSGDILTDALFASDLDVDIIGSGNLYFDGGEVDSQDVNVSGSGTHNALDLDSSQAEVHITGSGDVEINASERLEISISGSGDVLYTGDPSLNSRVVGSGSIRQRN